MCNRITIMLFVLGLSTSIAAQRRLLGAGLPLFIQFPGQETRVSVEIPADATVGDLKAQMQSHGLAANDHLMFGQVELRNEALLSDVGISAEGTIDVIKRRAFNLTDFAVFENPQFVDQEPRSMQFEMTGHSLSQFPDFKMELYCEECTAFSDHIPIALESLRFNMPRGRIIFQGGPECLNRDYSWGDIGIHSLRLIMGYYDGTDSPCMGYLEVYMLLPQYSQTFSIYPDAGVHGACQLHLESLICGIDHFVLLI